MATDFSRVASQIIGNLRLTDPELDTSVGTTTRKIIDAVAESIAEAYVDSHLLGYQYDIDSKIDAELDDFVQLFGMSRMPAKRASGVVTFVRQGNSAARNNVFIPINSQILSITTPTVVVQTVTGAYMEPSALTVDVAVQAVQAGPAGNLPAGSLTRIGSPIGGVQQVTNINPLTGGTAQETDAELRLRWKKTVFRNMAGTEQMYLGIALDHPNCYAANVIGSSKKRREQVQIVGGVGQCTVDDAAFTYSEPIFVGRNIDAGDINLRQVDYSWNTSVNPPRFNVLDAANMPDGELFEVDFEYQPKASRNEAGQGITNRVDIWVGGTRASDTTTGEGDFRSAVQTVIFRSGNTFTDTALPTPDPMSRHKFIRSDFTKPANGNVFIPLAWGPILAVPPVLSIAGQVYAQADGDHPLGTSEEIAGESVKYAYRVVHDDTAYGWTSTSRFGLEWHNDITYMPPNHTVFTIGGQATNPYLYNGMISDIQEQVERWRLLGVDAKVHQAKPIELRLSFAIMYEPRANRPAVDTEIDRTLAAYMQTRGFQGRVQASDLLQVAHNVVGVDNIRFLRGDDFPGYVSASPELYTVGVQQMVEGEVLDTGLRFVDGTGRPKDLRFGDNELPVFHSSIKVVKAENSFGTA